MKKLFGVAIAGAFAIAPFTRRVTDVESDQHFDISVDGKTYNVSAWTRLPRRLEEGDMVRVYDRRTNDNDITNASVTIIDNN